MKQKILLSIAAILLSACASHTPTWGDMSEAQIASWRKAGVVVEDVEKYKKEKMSARDVMEWKNSGFKEVEDILAWKKGHFSPSDAKQWHDKGFNVIQANGWKKNEFTLSDAVSWHTADFSLEKSIQYRGLGLIPNP